MAMRRAGSSCSASSKDRLAETSAPPRSTSTHLHRRAKHLVWNALSSIKLRITRCGCWTTARTTKYSEPRPRRKTTTVAVRGAGVSIQVAILKVLASHGSGQSTLVSLKRDIAILSASGPEWTARLKRLARRVPAIDSFSSGYVLRDQEGWQITPAGRDFLRMLEAVTQDNRLVEPVPPASREVDRPECEQRALIAVGYRLKNGMVRRR